MRRSLRGRVRAFFGEYERAVNTYAIERLCAAFAEHHIEAGPRGCECVVVDEAFHAALADRQTWLEERLGFREAEAVSVRTRTLGPGFALTRVRWRVRFAPPRRPPTVTQLDMTYLIRDVDDDFEIVVSLSHQDDHEVLRAVGLITDQGPIPRPGTACC